MRPFLATFSSLRFPALIVFLGLALLGGGGRVMIDDLTRERAAALKEAETRAANLTSVLSDHLHQIIRRLDQALLHLRQEYQDDPAWFMVRAENWQKTVYADLAFQIGGINADGKLLFSNLARTTTPVDLSDREHFRIHRDRNIDELFISKPVLGRVSQKWSIQFTRPLRAKDGAFAGVMVLSVEVDHLSKFYQSVDLGQGGSVLLVGADRVIRARSSPTPIAESPIGKQLPERGYFAPNAPPDGPLRLVSALDGVTRLGAYRRMQAYPLYINVLFSEQEVLAAFDEHKQEMVAGATAVGLLVVVGFGGVIGFAHRQERSRRQLAAARDHLAALEERWRLALEAVGDGVWDWEVSTGEVYFSPRWKAMLGFQEDEITANLDEWKTRVHPDDTPAVLADVEKLLSGETRFYVNEHRVQCRDGGYKWVLDRGVVVARDDAGRALRAVGTHTDISGRKEMEEALRRKTDALQRSNQELEAFAYVASHDLRQPLRTVNSYAALLERELGDNLNDDAKEFIGFIRDGARRMDRLIVDLLEYSRVGRNAAPFARISTKQAAGDALLNLDAALRESGAEVAVAPELPVVEGDESELIRLFQNLIGNAVKYRAPDRAPRIRIDCRNDGEGFWRFAVHDNGIGIAPEHFERVFGIFQRLHTTATATEGSGVGLAVCKKIVEHHGGRIWVTSEPEKGSVFYFTLPIH